MIANKITGMRNIHFVGIGGIGMSGIARILKNMGFSVSGSDLKKSDVTDELIALGIPVYIGHTADNIKDSGVMVTSSAISPGNSELIAAKEKKVTIIHRGEMLAELMRLKYGIAVAGTHGKTTTTAMVTAVCIAGGLGPTSIIGGKWVGINSNAELGKSEYLICEADESDGSFLRLSPIINIVTNIDIDHMDYYKTEENLISHFADFINKVPFFGKSVVCGDDNRIKALITRIRKPYITYGLNAGSDLRIYDIGMEKDLMVFHAAIHGRDLGIFRLGIAGAHNVLNSAAAIAVGLELEIPLETIKKSLGKFVGVNRRMTKLGNWEGFAVYDDYGHHPTEIKATLEAFRYKTDNLIVLFQPHRYTRTLDHYEAFSHSFGAASSVYISGIYPAGEKPVEGVSSKLIADKMKGRQNVYYDEDPDRLLALIKKNHVTQKGIILTIGAGDIYKYGQMLTANGEL